MKTTTIVLKINIICLTILTGCAFYKTPRIPVGSATDGKTKQAPELEWQEKTLVTAGVRLDVKAMKPEVRVQHRARFKAPDLEEIRSDASGTFNLYRFRDLLGSIADSLEGARSVVFIQPKIFVHGTAQGGNVLHLSSVDKKTLSLTFPVALVDGTRESLPSHEGTHAVVLPEVLRIGDLTRLKQDLRSQIGQEPKLFPLTTCPRQLNLLYVRGNETRRLPLIPTVSIRNRCPINEFFTVTVTSSREEIFDIIQNGITDGLGVQIEADFQVQYREPVAFYSLQMDPVKLYAELRRRFIEIPFGQSGDLMNYFSFQMVEPLQDLLRKLIQQTGAEEGWVPYFQGVQTLLDGFFEQVGPEQGCRPPHRCFRLKPEVKIRLDEPIELQWIESSTLLATRIIPTSTFVRGLAESYPLRISSERSLPMLGIIPTLEACASIKNNLPGCEGFSCERFPENVYCRNGRTKNAIHNFQVFPGSRIRLSFDRITEWGYELTAPREDTPAEQKKGNIRCADSQKIPGACEEYEEFCPVARVPFCKQQKDECAQERKLYEDHCRNERVTERNCGFLGLGSCQESLKENRTVCERTEIGKDCVKWNTSCTGEVEMVCPKTERRCKKPAIACSQWTTEFYSKYTYSEPWVRPRTVNLNQGQTIEQLWDGLDIEFSWLREDGKTWGNVTCPLKAFPSRIEGHSIKLTLDNQLDTDCQPFNSWNVREGRWPEIAIVNHIAYERPYVCGTLEWSHSISVDPRSKERVVDRLNYRCPERNNTSSDRPIINNYHPIVDLEGTISILGRSMDTVSSTSLP